MTDALDRVMGLHTRALQLHGQRTELLASNIANADTPNFLARDLDFQSVMAMQQGQRAITIKATQANHIGAASSETHRLMYREPVQPSADGNTVDVQLEKSAFTENAIGYQTQLSFLKAEFGRLMAAIRGE